MSELNSYLKVLFSLCYGSAVKGSQPYQPLPWQKEAREREVHLGALGSRGESQRNARLTGSPQLIIVKKQNKTKTFSDKRFNCFI